MLDEQQEVLVSLVVCAEFALPPTVFKCKDIIFVLSARPSFLLIVRA